MIQNIEKPFFDRKKIAEIINPTPLCDAIGDEEELREVEVDEQLEDNAGKAVSKEINKCYEKSSNYLAALISNSGYSLRDLALITEISATSLCRVMNRTEDIDPGRRFAPWLKAEVLAADVLGIPCSDMYMGENDPVLVPKKFVPILEMLRNAPACLNKTYTAIILDELRTAKAREKMLPELTTAQRKAQNVVDRLKDLAGDRFANPENPVYNTPHSVSAVFRKFYKYADKTKNGIPATPPTARVMIRMTAFADVPIDFLIADRYLRFLGAVYCDENQKYRVVPEKDMKWLADAVALRQEVCVDFCSTVLAEMLSAKMKS